jgi:hypothetical protein
MNLKNQLATEITEITEKTDVVSGVSASFGGGAGNCEYLNPLCDLCGSDLRFS